MQDGASSHTSNLCQNFLEETCQRRFVKKDEWAPKSPDLNVLDYYSWNAVQECVYDGARGPFQDIEQLKKRIKSVWLRAVDMLAVRKAIEQFRPRLACVVENKGGPIKQYYG